MSYSISIKDILMVCLFSYRSKALKNNNEIYLVRLIPLVRYRCQAPTTISRTDNFDKAFHGDVIKWKHFPRHWLLVRGIHRWPVNSPHRGQWHGALMFSLICERLSKQSWGWWFETPSHSLWRHYNVYPGLEVTEARQCTFTFIIRSKVPCDGIRLDWYRRHIVRPWGRALGCLLGVRGSLFWFYHRLILQCRVILNHIITRHPGGRLNIKMSTYQYRDPHVKDKTV